MSEAAEWAARLFGKYELMYLDPLVYEKEKDPGSTESWWRRLFLTNPVERWRRWRIKRFLIKLVSTLDRATGKAISQPDAARGIDHEKIQEKLWTNLPFLYKINRSIVNSIGSKGDSPPKKLKSCYFATVSDLWEQRESLARRAHRPRLESLVIVDGVLNDIERVSIPLSPIFPSKIGSRKLQFLLSPQPYHYLSPQEHSLPLYVSEIAYRKASSDNSLVAARLLRVVDNEGWYPRVRVVAKYCCLEGHPYLDVLAILARRLREPEEGIPVLQERLSTVTSSIEKDIERYSREGITDDVRQDETIERLVYVKDEVYLYPYLLGRVYKRVYGYRVPGWDDYKSALKRLSTLLESHSRLLSYIPITLAQDAERIVVDKTVAACDTGPLISAFQCGQVDLLKQYFKTIYIAPSQVAEFERCGAGKELDDLIQEKFVVVAKALAADEKKRAEMLARRIAEHPSSVDRDYRSHLPEAELMIIAARPKLGCALILLDESAARAVAEEERLQIIGFPAVIGQAGLEGILTRDRIRRLLTICQQQGTQYSNELIEHVAEKYGR